MDVMVTIKSSFNNFNILETSKDSPNIPPRLNEVLRAKGSCVSREEGGPLNLIPLDNVVGSKRLRSRRVKIFAVY